MKHIGVDIDDTAAPFFDKFALFVNEKYGKNVSAVEIATDYLKILGSQEKGYDILKEFVDSGRSYECNVYEDFKEVFGTLKNNYELSMVTARSYDDRKKTKNFFRKNVQGFDLDIHYMWDYHEPKKSVVCKQKGISLLVDDSLSNAIDCANEGIEVFLFDQPWNRDFEGHKNITRFKNWYEIMGDLL